VTGTAHLQLTVGELSPRDAGRGLVRLSKAHLDALGLRSGGVVELRGAKLTAARALPARLEDRDRGLVLDGLMLDGLGRLNAGVALGETVAVRALQPELARAVTLAALSGSAPKIADLRTLLQDRVVCAGDRVRVELYGTKALEFSVTGCEPSGAVLVGANTRLALENVPAKSASGNTTGTPVQISYEDIGGLGKEVARVRELVELPLRHPQVFEQLGIEPPRGVLLYGPPGTGKTTIARAVARETQAHFISVAGPEIIGKFYGDSEKRLREIFEQAKAKAPSIIFLDEIDAIGPKRSEVQGEVEKRVVAQLLSLMDGLGGRGQVVVIGATNLPDNLDPALRRPGRFDREVVINPPDAAGRLEILEVHTRGMPLGADVDLKRLSAVTHGFVGADLTALCREAAMNRVRVQLPTWTLAGREPSAAELLQLEVRMEDFQAALREVSPSLIRELEGEVSETNWADIGGLSDAKATLKEAVELPLRHPELFAAMRLEPPRGILLSGPPGTGKTLIARAVAKESEANFISVRGAQFLSKYYGESEKAVRELFRKARASAPCVVFFDEIDALLSRRSADGDAVSMRVVGQFLAEMDGANALGGVIILGATNRPEALDPALLRPGRFERIIEFRLPETADRLEILRVHLRGRPHEADLPLKGIAADTSGWSGAELGLLVQRAALQTVRRQLESRSERTQPDISLDFNSRVVVSSVSQHPISPASVDLIRSTDLTQAFEELKRLRQV
jgi:transitional endoplasmic reticulum ATPase